MELSLLRLSCWQQLALERQSLSKPSAASAWQHLVPMVVLTRSSEASLAKTRERSLGRQLSLQKQLLPPLALLHRTLRRLLSRTQEKILHLSEQRWRPLLQAPGRGGHMPGASAAAASKWQQTWTAPATEATVTALGELHSIVSHLASCGKPLKPNLGLCIQSIIKSALIWGQLYVDLQNSHF
jgi:hypothetical protein